MGRSACVLVGWVVFGLAGSAPAKCTEPQPKLTAAPTGVVLPLEPVVLVELVNGASPSIPPQFEAVDGPERVPATVVLSGASGSLLKPERPLRPGRWVVTQNGLTSGEWTVVDLQPGAAPALTGTPSVGTVTTGDLGCSSMLAVPISGLETNEPDLVVEARFTSWRGEAREVFLPQQGSVTLGHGVCHRGLALPAGPVSVVFTPLDRFGRRGPASEPVRFRVPGDDPEAPSEPVPWVLVAGAGLGLLAMAGVGWRLWRGRHRPRMSMSVPGMRR